MLFAHGEMITLLRDSPGGTDAYGDPLPSTTERIPVMGCGIAPRTSTEPTERGRQGVIVGLTLYMPGPSARSTDRVEYQGNVYDIDGEPGAWRSPFTGWAPGVEVALRRAVG